MCAWCNDFLGGDPSSHEVTHGICPDCAAAVLLGYCVHGAAAGTACGPWDDWVDIGGEG